MNFRSEAAALAGKTGDALSGLTRAVEESHARVSTLVDTFIPTGLRPWRTVSTATTDGIYDAVDAGIRRLQDITVHLITPRATDALTPGTVRHAVP